MIDKSTTQNGKSKYLSLLLSVFSDFSDFSNFSDLSAELCFRWRSKKGTDPFLGRPGACALKAGEDTLRDICCACAFAEPFSLWNCDKMY